MVPWKFTNRTLLVLMVLGVGLFIMALFKIAPLRDLKFEMVNWPDLGRQIDRFIAEHKTQASISLSENWHDRNSLDLARPETFFLTTSIPKDFLFLFEAGENCKGLAKKPKSPEKDSQAALQIKKAMEVNGALCAGQMPSGRVLSQPPLFHPFGGTWVAWIYNNSKKDDNARSWLQENQKSLHLLELGQYPFLQLSQTEKIISALSPGQLSDLVSGHVFIETPRFVILLYQAKLGAREYNVYPREQWQEFIDRQSIAVVSSESESCQIREGLICWGTNEPLKERRDFWLVTGILSAFASLAFMAAYLYLQRRFLLRQTELDREIIMQTLAHELRHPVTSFVLSLEVLREHYEEFPDTVKAEFLRMSDQTVRLKRLIHSSRQYLQTQSQTGKPFRFQFLEIPSPKEYLQSALEPYLEKIELEINMGDDKFRLDPYWVQVCLQNLVKNALVHGQKPIRVRARIIEDSLVVEVEDSGATPSLSFEEMIVPFNKSKTSSGLGLGLNLVYRLSHLMGGGLTFLQSPNRFILKIRDQNG